MTWRCPWVTTPLDEALAASVRSRRVREIDRAALTVRLRAFYDYWNAKRGTRPMPSRADIDPAEIRTLLPYIAMTDVLDEEPWLRYRLVGTMQVRLRGEDPTGLPVLGHHIGRHLSPKTAGEVLLNYRAVIERGWPVHDFHSTLGPAEQANSFGHGAVRETGALLLPLSSDGTNVDIVFCCTDTTPLPGVAR
jgi:hypothetical protein